VTLFRLEGVTLRRGGARVLEWCDASLPAGATCVWGPSGSGKSSLLRLLNRLADPDEGRVLLEGRDVRELDVLALRRRVVLMQQLPSPLPGTVEDNVLYGPRLANRPADVTRLLELVALPRAFAARDAATLSVGQQQRLMLARALALEPEALLLDEPTSALDEAAREAVEETLAHLRDEVDVSLVIVTHELEQARRLAEWVVELRDGRVVGQGAAGELLAR
jgi:putative ABC transport system ATP-binding protein